MIAFFTLLSSLLTFFAGWSGWSAFQDWLSAFIGSGGAA